MHFVSVQRGDLDSVWCRGCEQREMWKRLLVLCASRRKVVAEKVKRLAHVEWPVDQ